MRIHTDTDRCAGTAMCVFVAPEIFTLSDEDVVEVRARVPGAQHHDSVRHAVRACPTATISVRESVDGEDDSDDHPLDGEPH
ncbi:ferredoxin [Spiractinospora alimapuensis]|uniref:ferredoxin n=1 Tax=Spiractinospora alimapuensis TaxID=2820884 RepID=UPI001F289858|nr:ferredoxin [Spiractinospora alimapuensis]QVQ54406.1 ferredoxin [Spiractinospora alimapuensis]